MRQTINLRNFDKYKTPVLHKKTLVLRLHHFINYLTTVEPLMNDPLD